MTKEERYNLIKKVSRKLELKNKSAHAMMSAKNTRYRKAVNSELKYDCTIDEDTVILEKEKSW